MPNNKPVRIDVVSDVVCPWCFIGKHRLESALKLKPGIAVEVHWRPYFLNDWIPREGIARDEYLTKKFGSPERYKGIAQRVGAAAAADGLVYASDKMKRQPNTLDCHRLIYWAEAIDKAGYQPGQDVLLALDCASSEFFKDGRYVLESEELQLSSGQFTDYLAALADKYPIISIEDGMAENDWDGWKILTERLGRKIQIVGDDVFVTNTKILRQGIADGVANSILIKVNQIGTLTETFAAIEMAKRAGYTAVISHRSGETEDTIIADIAVGMNTLQIKTGSLSRSDRVAKYNQLLRIEEDLGDTVGYPGTDAFYQLR